MLSVGSYERYDEVADGVRVGPDFPTRAHAIRALRRAGIKRWDEYDERDLIPSRVAQNENRFIAFTPDPDPTVWESDREIEVRKLDEHLWAAHIEAT